MGWEDRNVEFPYRYRRVPVPGTDDIVDLIPTPGEVIAEGTFTNKANMLTDETSALLGGAGTVNEALALIGRALAEGVRIASGEYSGDGQNAKTIYVGFTPKLLIVFCYRYSWVATSGTATVYQANLSVFETRAFYMGQPRDTVSGVTRNYAENNGNVTMSCSSLSSGNERYALNYASAPYRWVAFG